MNPLSIGIYLLCAVLGFLSVAIEIPDETIKKLQKHLITRFTIGGHFKLSRLVNKIIYNSVQSGKASDALKFGLGILILFVYFFLINLIINLVKMVIYNIFGVFPPNYMPAFSLMFGAGVMSYLIWLKQLHKNTKMMKGALKERHLGSALKSTASAGIIIITLVYTYILWVLGEWLFLNLSVEYTEDLLPLFSGFALIFGIFLICILSGSIIFAHAEKSPANGKPEEKKSEPAKKEE